MMARFAKFAGYEYFLWNEIVYAFGKGTGPETAGHFYQTQYTLKDIR